MDIEISRLDQRHRHCTDEDNYQIIWMARGIRSMAVDFQTFSIYPGTIVFLTPGRIVKLLPACEPPVGWILRFSRAFFKAQQINSLLISDAELYSAEHEIPRIVLSPKIGIRVQTLAEMIAEISGSKIPGKELAISSLFRSLLVYCDSHCNIKVTLRSKRNDLNLVARYKQLVSDHFCDIHQVAVYASMLHVTPKHLNQVVKNVMGVTAKSLIQEQILIKASRDLKFSTESIKEIAARLGFLEADHFSHFFKKASGISPSRFRQA